MLLLLLSLLLLLVRVLVLASRAVQAGAQRQRWWSSCFFSPFVQVWSIFTLPLSMAFEPINNRLLVANVIVDFTFLADIVKHFNTGFHA